MTIALLLFIIIVLAKRSEEGVDITELLKAIKAQQEPNSANSQINSKIQSLLKEAVKDKEKLNNK